jgi:hypothetical protein
VVFWGDLLELRVALWWASWALWDWLLEVCLSDKECIWVLLPIYSLGMLKK